MALANYDEVNPLDGLGAEAPPTYINPIGPTGQIPGPRPGPHETIIYGRPVQRPTVQVPGGSSWADYVVGGTPAPVSKPAPKPAPKPRPAECAGGTCRIRLPDGRWVTVEEYQKLKLTYWDLTGKTPPADIVVPAPPLLQTKPAPTGTATKVRVEQPRTKVEVTGPANDSAVKDRASDLVAAQRRLAEAKKMLQRSQYGPEGDLNEREYSDAYKKATAEVKLLEKIAKESRDLDNAAVSAERVVPSGKIKEIAETAIRNEVSKSPADTFVDTMKAGLSKGIFNAIPDWGFTSSGRVPSFDAPKFPKEEFAFRVTEKVKANVINTLDFSLPFGVSLPKELPKGEVIKLPTILANAGAPPKATPSPWWKRAAAAVAEVTEDAITEAKAATEEVVDTSKLIGISFVLAKKLEQRTGVPVSPTDFSKIQDAVKQGGEAGGVGKMTSLVFKHKGFTVSSSEEKALAKAYASGGEAGVTQQAKKLGEDKLFSSTLDTLRIGSPWVKPEVESEFQKHLSSKLEAVKRKWVPNVDIDKRVQIDAGQTEYDLTNKQTEELNKVTRNAHAMSWVTAASGILTPDFVAKQLPKMNVPPESQELVDSAARVVAGRILAKYDLEKISGLVGDTTWTGRSPAERLAAGRKLTEITNAMSVDMVNEVGKAIRAAATAGGIKALAIQDKINRERKAFQLFRQEADQYRREGDEFAYADMEVKARTSADKLIYLEQQYAQVNVQTLNLTDTAAGPGY